MCFINILWFFIFGNLALAKSENDVKIINDNEISISEKEYKNLLSQGFEDIDIQIMDIDTYNMNKDILAEETSETVKYIKTYEVNNNLKANSSISDKENKTQVNEEITKEQMDKELKKLEEKNNTEKISAFGTETGNDATSYKKITHMFFDSPLKAGSKESALVFSLVAIEKFLYRLVLFVSSYLERSTFKSTNCNYFRFMLQ